MTSTVPAIIVDEPKGAFRQGTIERRDLRPDDVRIAVAFAGICHSDIHQAREEWGEARFPMVPGHEIAGTVTEVGSDVTAFQVGDRVGVGCMVDSCGECEMCRADHENFCAKGMVVTYNGVNYDGEEAYGGYSQEIVVSERFTLRIPEGISLEEAAPLLCAGITTYTPLRRWVTEPGQKVAVVGMGGLGHMGVKIASAMGAEVTVLSRTTSKEEDGRAFGASDYRATSDDATWSELEGQFDVILCTISADLPVDSYLKLLKPFGAFVNVGLPENAQSVHFGSLIGGDKTIAGSNIGGIKGTQEMLDFCAEHGIGSTVEVIGADEVDRAYDDVVDSKVRYRYVIDTSTITPKD